MEHNTMSLWTILCCFFFPCKRRGRGEEDFFILFFPTFSLSLPLSGDLKTDKTHTPWIAKMKMQKRQVLRVIAQWLPDHPTPVPDWTGVVALSPPFPPYKYQGREMSRGQKYREREGRKNYLRYRGGRKNEKKDRERELCTFKKDISVEHLPAAEAQLTLLWCCCAAHVVPPVFTSIPNYFLFKLHFS